MIIDGKKIAASIRDALEKKVQKISGRKPGLAFVLVGDDPASHTYVHMKKKACKKLGYYSEDTLFSSSTPQKELIDHIHKLNKDPKIDGILVQLPLPNHMNEAEVLQQINPEKDVDGFHPINVGKMLLGDTTGFIPCTPKGIKVLLEHSKIDVEGKHLVIVGRSNLVGKPLAAIMMQKMPHCNATVTVAHSRTKNLKAITKSADILVVAIGSAHFITADHVNENAIVIDVGINREGSIIVGDVDYKKVAPKVQAITPVPGGVGPMTIAMLMENTYQSYRHHSK